MSPQAAVAAYSKGEEIAHLLSHGLGLLLSIAGLWVLASAASARGDALDVVACSVFGASLVLLYAASTLYHGIPVPRARWIFQKLDHCAIYVLIAGTYTPFALGTLRGGPGWTLFAGVWALAILGVGSIVLSRPVARRGSLVLYLGMGWIVLFVLPSLIASIAPAGLGLLVAGGLTYSAGVLFYVWRRLPYNHAIWHLFVLGGSALHFCAVLYYVIPAQTL
ncbi:MAG: hemolysin III family protein [Myxococcota bacterium]